MGGNFLAAYNTDPNGIFESGLEMQMLMRILKERIRANKIVLIVDGSYRGAIELYCIKATVNNTASAAPTMGGRELIICSSDKSQSSWESKRYENSVFTHYLWEALRTNGAQSSFTDEFETLKKKVQQEVLQDWAAVQTPLLKTN